MLFLCSNCHNKLLKKVQQGHLYQCCPLSYLPSCLYAKTQKSLPQGGSGGGGGERGNWCSSFSTTSITLEKLIPDVYNPRQGHLVYARRGDSTSPTQPAQPFTLQFFLAVPPAGSTPALAMGAPPISHESPMFKEWMKLPYSKAELFCISNTGDLQVFLNDNTCFREAIDNAGKV